MEGWTTKVCLALFLVIQVYSPGASGWAIKQAWSFKNGQECLSYYANMTIQEGSWCHAMWDGLLCWAPSPFNSVSLLPCPPTPNSSTDRTRTAQKRCSPEGRWSHAEVPSTASSPSPSSSGPEEDDPYQEMTHPCLSPQGDDQEGPHLSAGVIQAYSVSSKISHRFARTTVTAKVVNTNTLPSNLQFRMTLPKTAFISSLVMEIDGANYTSSVKEKSVANMSYQVAKKEGKNAALVEQSGMQSFEVTASFVSRQVTFYVIYEELLRRLDGQYIQKIYVRPGARIPEAEVNVHILEPEPIGDYRILELPGQELHGNPGATVSEDLTNDNEIQVRYKHVDPPNGAGKGVDGTFTISYNLRNHVNKGMIQRAGNYFSHFVPLDVSDHMPKMSTHTVFALDVSSSMGSGKLKQMKAGMKSIIKSMTPTDSFEILAFSSHVASLGVYNGTHHRRALRRVKKLQLMSYSDLNAAYLQAVRSADEYLGVPPVVKQIVMITDGHPTQAIRDPLSIRRNVFEANKNKIPVFGIGFGPEAHFNLIQQISADSGAFAHHLDSRANLATDLKSLFKEISRPILTNLTLTYPENEVDPDSVVKIAYSNFYAGGEVVAAGQVHPGVVSIHPWVMGVGQIGPMQLEMDEVSSADHPEDEDEESVVARLWAYLKVQHLLKEAEMNDNYLEVKKLLDQATHLALKFRFVTHVTSLVVRDATGETETILESDSLQLPLQHWPSPSSPGRGPSDIQLADAPQPARKQRYQPHPQGYDLDPHFVVYAPGNDLPFCFDYHAHDGAYISLIKDSVSGIVVNGKTMSSVENPKLTYITKLFIAFGKVNITVTPQRMEVDCVGEDGSLEVNSLMRSLWPFYKRNGRMYKKMMTSYTKKRTPNQSFVTASHQSKDSSKTKQREGATSAKPETSPHAPPKDFPSDRRGSFVDSGSAEETHSAGNSVIDDYIPSGSLGKQHPRGGKRLPRQSIIQAGTRTRTRTGDRKSLQNDYRLCNSNSSWEDGVGKKYGDVMVIMDKKRNMELIVGDGEAHFVIVRSEKDNQLFLGFYLKDEQIMSPKASGLIGQFTSKNITISTVPSSSPLGDNPAVDLVVKRRNRRNKYRTTHVSGYLSKRRSLLDQKHVECIQVRRQGKGLLDGKPSDYILGCLQC